MPTFWRKPNGKIVVGAAGRPVSCPECPCGGGGVVTCDACPGKALPATLNLLIEQVGGGCAAGPTSYTTAAVWDGAAWVFEAGNCVGDQLYAGGWLECYDASGAGPGPWSFRVTGNYDTCDGGGCGGHRIGGASAGPGGAEVVSVTCDPLEVVAEVLVGAAQYIRMTFTE